MSTKLTVKCSEEDLARWKDAAWDSRVTLSEWVRRRLNGARMTDVKLTVTELAAGAPDRAVPGQGTDVATPAPAANPAPKAIVKPVATPEQKFRPMPKGQQAKGKYDR